MLPLETGPSQSPVLGFLGTAINLSAAWLSSPKAGDHGRRWLGHLLRRTDDFDRDQPRLLDRPPCPGASRVASPARRRESSRPPDVDGRIVAPERISGGKLPAGTSRLAEGVVELEFDGGARVSIEGPAEFAPRSGQRMELTRGRLVAYVPKQARGFTVDTPTAEVIDLGTEFGVEVDGRARPTCTSSGAGWK